MTNALPEDRHRIGEMLLLTAARLTRIQRDILGSLEYPLTFRQYRSLTRINEGHHSVTELAALAHRTLPTMSKNIEVLVRQGLIRRGEDPKDRRTAVLELTEKGGQVLKAADAAIADLIQLLVSVVEVEERPQLSDQLSRIRDLVEASLEDD